MRGERLRRTTARSCCDVGSTVFGVRGTHGSVTKAREFSAGDDENREYFSRSPTFLTDPRHANIDPQQNSSIPRAWKADPRRNSSIPGLGKAVPAGIDLQSRGSLIVGRGTSRIGEDWRDQRGELGSGQGIFPGSRVRRSIRRVRADQWRDWDRRER